MSAYKVKEPTQQELVDRVKFRAQDDMLNVEIPDYACYLDAEHLREAIPSIDDKTLRLWTQGEWSERDILKRIYDYLPKAFDWANREKDLETLRAFTHFVAWTWILGDRDFSLLIEVLEWKQYGKPQFRMIAERYGVDWSKLDDGVLREMPELEGDMTDDGGFVVNMDGNKPQMRDFETSKEIEDAAWSKRN